MCRPGAVRRCRCWSTSDQNGIWRRRLESTDPGHQQLISDDLSTVFFSVLTFRAWRFSCSMAAWTGNLLERTNLGWIPSIWRLRPQAHINRLMESLHGTCFIFNKESGEEENLSRKAEDDPLRGRTELNCSLLSLLLCCCSVLPQLSMFYIKKYQVMQ